MKLKEVIPVIGDDVEMDIVFDYGGFEVVFKGNTKEFVRTQPEYRRKFLYDYVVDYIIPEDEETIIIFLLK